MHRSEISHSNSTQVLVACMRRTTVLPFLRPHLGANSCMQQRDPCLRYAADLEHVFVITHDQRDRRKGNDDQASTEVPYFCLRDADMLEEITTSKPSALCFCVSHFMFKGCLKAGESI